MKSEEADAKAMVEGDKCVRKDREAYRQNYMIQKQKDKEVRDKQIQLKR